MRVLWLSGNPGNYNSDKGNSVRIDGSWISSLQNYILKQEDIELGLCFIGNDCLKKEIYNKTTYYILPKPNFFDRFSFSKKDSHYVKSMAWVISDFKPDIIHVFGSETVLGLVYRVTNIPILLHIQGILKPYDDAWYPPLYNSKKVIQLQKGNFIKKIRGAAYHQYSLLREAEILKHIHNYYGRTEWDYNVTNILSPNNRYFYCSEMLRPSFYSEDTWKYKNREKIQIVSVISNAIYKGQDCMLKTAELLKEMNINFEWNVCGISEMSIAEKIVNIQHNNVNVKLLGKVSMENLKSLLLDCSCYVHLSYIENSPNSICEAQILGMPIVAANVGGVSSLIEDKISGILVPSNDRFITATNILKVSKEKSFAEKIAENSREVAKKRHCPNAIIDSVISAYKTLLNI